MPRATLVSSAAASHDPDGTVTPGGGHDRAHPVGGSGPAMPPYVVLSGRGSRRLRDTGQPDTFLYTMDYKRALPIAVSLHPPVLGVRQSDQRRNRLMPNV